MKGFLANLRDGFNAVREDDERGDIVQTLIIIALLVLATIFVFRVFLWPAIEEQAVNTSDHIRNSPADVIG